MLVVVDTSPINYLVLLEQTAVEFLERCRERGIGVFLGGVYNSGILAIGPQPGATYNYAEAPPEIMERVRQIEAVCARHDVPLHRAAAQFALAHPGVTAVVLGAVTPAEVQANRAALFAPIPPELWADLRREGLLRERRSSADDCNDQESKHGGRTVKSHQSRLLRNEHPYISLGLPR